MIINLRDLVGDNTQQAAFERRSTTRKQTLLATLATKPRVALQSFELFGVVVNLYSYNEIREYQNGLQDSSCNFDQEENSSVAYRLGFIDGLC